MTSWAQPKHIWRLVEESLSDAAFLWTRLDQALNSPDFTLFDVERWVEKRLIGSLDGVRLAGSAALSPLLAEAFADQDPGLVSTSAYVLATMGTAEAETALEKNLRQLTDEGVSAAARGLGRAGNTSALRSLWTRVQDASAASRACLLEALAFCGAAPEVEWSDLLTAENAVLRRTAARALASLPASERSEVMWIALQSSDLEVRNRGNIAALIAGDSAAWPRCCEAVRTRDATVSSALAMLMVAMLGSRSEHAQLCQALAVPELKPHALWALGFAGSCDAVDACLAEAMAGQHVAVACGAIAAITGVELSKLAVVASEAGSSASTPTQDTSEAEGQTARAIDVAALERWWKDERQRFDPGARYQRGKQKTLATLREGLSSGKTARRHAIALELAVRSRGAYRVQTFGFCSEQRRQMKLDALDSRQLRDAVNALGIEPIAEA